MAKAKEGDKVKVHYTGKLQDGSTFDSSREREPLEFTIGSGQLIKGFDLGVRDLEVGEQTTLTLSPEEAYGAVVKDLIEVVNKAGFPSEIVPEIGQELQTEDKNGQTVNLRVVAVEGDQVTLDANHPLAGQTLIFDIELMAIS